MNVSVSVRTAPKSLAWHEVTDWYIPETEDQEVLVYPGAIKAGGELLEHARNLRELALWQVSQAVSPMEDWQVTYRERLMRAHRQNTVGGTLYIFRTFSLELPALKDLGLPDEIYRLMLRPFFAEHGGLVLVSGGAGQGKSTTCAAILLERVKRFGYFCLTVEDPPEFAMHKEYLSPENRVGQIIQVPARTQSFSFDLKNALRCYPSNMKGSMLMVGEVRDGNAAAQLLRAAVNGHLVFATLHAGDPIAAIERVLSLAKSEMDDAEARALLAHSLRAVLHQRLVGGRLIMEVLLSAAPNSQVAARIKNGHIPQLSSDVEQQKTLLSKGRLLNTLFQQKNGT